MTERQAQRGDRVEGAPERRWRRARDGSPLIIAHRGASAHAMENTEAAFRRAATDGADGVELDVLCCASGEVVVFHDDDLARLIGQPDRVVDLSWSRLREVRLRDGSRIPSLEQAMDACGPVMLVNIELKASGVWWDPAVVRLVEAVDAIVTAGGWDDRVLISSFSPAAVALWKARRPDVPCALLFERDAVRPLRRAWAATLLRPFALHPQDQLCAPDDVRRWHSAGYLVNTWTVDHPARIRELAALGLDGIITNDPAAARRVLTAQVAGFAQ